MSEAWKPYRNISDALPEAPPSNTGSLPSSAIGPDPPRASGWPSQKHLLRACGGLEPLITPRSAGKFHDQRLAQSRLPAHLDETSYARSDALVVLVQRKGSNGHGGNRGHTPFHGLEQVSCSLLAPEERKCEEHRAHRASGHSVDRVANEEQTRLRSGSRQELGPRALRGVRRPPQGTSQRWADTGRRPRAEALRGRRRGRRCPDLQCAA
jgi:hypothetical protein